MKVHTGTLVAGFVYLAIGVAFVMEALGAWTLQISDLRLAGPIALVVAGLTVVLAAWARPDADKAT